MSKRKEIYHIISSNLEPMTYREIALKAGLKSTSNVHFHINKLKQEGLVTSDINGVVSSVTKAQREETILFYKTRCQALENCLSKIYFVLKPHFSIEKQNNDSEATL